MAAHHVIGFLFWLLNLAVLGLGVALAGHTLIMDLNCSYYSEGCVITNPQAGEFFVRFARGVAGAFIAVTTLKFFLDVYINVTLDRKRADGDKGTTLATFA